MIQIRSLYAALACCLLLGCGEAITPLSSLPPGATVLAFGDSLTAGYGAPAGQSYPALLAERAVLKVENAGVSGELSAAGLQRLPGLLEQHRPQLVILCHGGNDLLRSTGIENARSNLLAMINLIQDSGAQVLLLGVPQPGIFLSTADFYNELAAQTGVAYLPELMTDVLSDNVLKSDAAHPNAAGYQIIAAGIQDYLFAAGAL
jgi:acyl-CoA thioesterase I